MPLDAGQVLRDHLAKGSQRHVAHVVVSMQKKPVEEKKQATGSTSSSVWHEEEKEIHHEKVNYTQIDP